MTATENDIFYNPMGFFPTFHKRHLTQKELMKYLLVYIQLLHEYNFVEIKEIGAYSLCLSLMINREEGNQPGLHIQFITTEQNSEFKICF